MFIDFESEHGKLRQVVSILDISYGSLVLVYILFELILLAVVVEGLSYTLQLARGTAYGLLVLH